MFVILLNFLIAVISNSFEMVINNERLIVEYRSKCVVNREAASIFNFLRLYTEPLNIMILSISTAKLDIEESEMDTFMSTLRKLVKTEMKNLRQVLNV